jgi:hypothetical protein
VYCRPFSIENFVEVVQNASGAAASDAPPNTQTLYLADYLATLGAKTIVVEDHYIDRHFMEEVSLYYSKSLLPRPNWTTRVHLFRRELDDDELAARLRAAAEGEVTQTTQYFQDSYCGYVVVRPLPSVPIGRTVLQHLRDKPDRSFPTCQAYAVHFLGVELRVHGLAFVGSRAISPVPYRIIS